MKRLLLFVATGSILLAQQDLTPQLLNIKRVYVDRLTGGETAAQMRDLLISSFEGSKLFIVTENQERADAILRGAAEDLIYTDTFQSSDGVEARASTGSSEGESSGGFGRESGPSTRSSRNAGVSIGDRESSNVKERKHEAFATVRLVNKDGDVIWSTTQQSGGAKFRNASSDVAEKVTRQLMNDFEQVKRAKAGPSPSGAPPKN